jgi:hypothetical protein
LGLLGRSEIIVTCCLSLLKAHKREALCSEQRQHRYQRSDGKSIDKIFSETEHGSKEATTCVRTDVEFIDCFIRIYYLECGERMAHRVGYYEHTLAKLLKTKFFAAWPVFKDNFQRKNIMIWPDEEPVIIDWEFASWMPKYWVYTTATFCIDNGG